MKNAFLSETETRKALADFIIKSNKSSMGEKCAEFEKAFAQRQGREEAILFNSGGSANLAILQSLKNMGSLKAGDKMGFSALTWSTNVMPIIQMGLEPVPVDCEIETLNVSSAKLMERVSAVPLKALFITNVLGFAGDLDAIRQVCAEKNIILIEDNCESLGTELPSGKTGNFGLASSFSFFVAHHMSTIEGGMVCTDDEHLAQMLRIVRANGWDRNLAPHHQKKWRAKHSVTSELHSKYVFYDLGFNLRPTEITGFLGLAQLKFLDESLAVRENNYLRMESALLKNPDLLPMERGHLTKFPAFSMPFICKDAAAFKKYTARFQEKDIEIRPIIAGNMQEQPFYKKYVAAKYAIPNTEFIHHHGFYCGNCPDYADHELKTITDCLTTI